MNFKETLFILLATLILIELFSLIASKNNLLIFNQKPEYLKFKSKFKGVDWRTEEESWGSWHKKNFITKHEKTCFNVTYKSNDVGARSDFSFNKIKNSNNAIVLGDSFAEGIGVENKDTFAYLLNKNYKTTLNSMKTIRIFPWI